VSDTLFHTLFCVLSVRLMSPIGEMLQLGGGFSLQLPEEIDHGRLVRISRYNVLTVECSCNPTTPTVIVQPALSPKPDVGQAPRS